MATLRAELVKLAKSGGPKPRNRTRLGMALRNLRGYPEVYAYRELKKHRPDWLESHFPEDAALREWEGWVLAFERQDLEYPVIRAAKKRYYREVQEESSPTFQRYLRRRSPKFLKWLRENTYQDALT